MSLFFLTLSHYVHVVPVLVYSGVFVSGAAHRYSLRNLLPGNYDIFMQANTDAGAGTAGPIANVHIGEGGTRRITVP